MFIQAKYRSVALGYQPTKGFKAECGRYRGFSSVSIRNRISAAILAAGAEELGHG
jgi:hypothetical protein